MNNWAGFGRLDLTQVEEQSFKALAPKQEYVLKCTSAAVEDVAGSKTNKKLVVDFKAKGGAGEIRMNFNIFNTSVQAQEIGLSQLKTFLIKAGHPTPNNPGDVKTLVGLIVGAYVDLGKPYRNSKGDEVQRSEIKRFMALDEMNEAGSPTAYMEAQKQAAAKPALAPAPASDSFDDDIPF